MKLAVTRARATGAPAVFWLDENRAHDAQLIEKVKAYLPEHDTAGLQIEIMAPAEATRFSLERIRKGEDTISVTGNVLRDYLTDLFPILEVGTSAKMLSIVPLMNGGGLFETGAGGSAPKHVQQFVKENHLRWDSLGEFLALAASLEHLARGRRQPAGPAAGRRPRQGHRHPPRRGPVPVAEGRSEIDNRGSHFYLALYWAEELASPDRRRRSGRPVRPDGRGAGRSDEATIVDELSGVQGEPVDIGGYYFPDAGPGHRRDAPERHASTPSSTGWPPARKEDPSWSPSRTA